MENPLIKQKTLILITIRDNISKILELRLKKGFDLNQTPSYMYGLFLEDDENKNLRIRKTKVEVLGEESFFIYKALNTLSFLKKQDFPLGCFFVFVKDAVFEFLLLSPNGKDSIKASISIDSLLDFFDFDDIDYIENPKDISFLKDLDKALTVVH